MKSCKACGESVSLSSSGVSRVEDMVNRVRKSESRCRALNTLLSRIIEERYGDDKYLSYSKVSYLSTKAQRQRLKLMALMQGIEKKKLKLAEKAISVRQNASRRQELAVMAREKRKAVADQRVALESVSENNKNVLYQMLCACRWRAALDVFLRFQIDCQIPQRRADGRKIKLAGCSTILSLPLPNSGDFSGAPAEVVVSALAHVAHLVDSLSALLCIPIPHPLYPFDAQECAMVSPHGNKSRHIALAPSFQPLPPSCDNKHVGASENLTSTALYHVSEPNTREYLFTPASTPPEKTNPSPYPTMRPSPQTQDTPEDDRAVNPEFALGLTLLQADVVALCVKAGIAPDSLWPPQCLLLNLHELYALCVRIVTQIHGERSSRVTWLGFAAARDSSDEFVPAIDERSVDRVLLMRYGKRFANSHLLHGMEECDTDGYYDVVPVLEMKYASSADTVGSGDDCEDRDWSVVDPDDM